MRDARTGAGPFQFNVGALASGEQYLLDWRELERNGRPRWYSPYLPFDSITVVNQSTEGVTVTTNGEYESFVPANTIESASDVAVVRATVLNEGTGAITDGELRVEVERSPYDADDAARDSVGKPWFRRALDDLIPGGVP